MTARRRPRVLHIDDDPAARRAIARILDKAGFAVAGASDGAGGLKAALRGRWALIVLDVDLPGMSGFEVCERLRTEPRTRATPVLHLSAARVDLRDRVRGFQAGADAYLVQPVAPDELIAVARALVARGALARPGAATLTTAATARALAAGREEALRVASLLLRGPLSTISINASSLAATASDPVTHARTTAVAEAHRIVAQVLADLAELAWFESSRAPLVLEPRPAVVVVNAAALRVANAAREAGISFVLEASDAPALRCDPSSLERALEILLRHVIRGAARGTTIALRATASGNVIRFTVDGELSLTESARAELENDLWSTRQVRGAPEAIEVALARSIVAAHGGRVAVESRAGPLHVEIPVSPFAA